MLGGPNRLRLNFSLLVILIAAELQYCVTADTISPNKAGVVSVECGLKSEHVTFRYNAEQGVFVEAVGTSVDEEPHILNIETDSVFEEGDLEIAKKCWCTQYYEEPVQYCPANFNSCIVRGGDGSVKCYELSKSEYLLRGSWPIVLFWYGLLTLAWFCSNRGSQARGYVRRLWFGCREGADEPALREEVDSLINANGFKIAQLRRSAIARRERLIRLENTPELAWFARWMRRNEEPDMDRVLALNSPQPAPGTNTVLLSMKVKAFSSNGNHDITNYEEKEKDPETGNATSMYARDQSHRVDAPFDEIGTKDPLQPEPRTEGGETKAEGVEMEWTNDDDDDEDENTCAICLKSLEEGEKIGDISCGHLFHKACLKDWLRRKNSCPLCQRKDIAELRRTWTSGSGESGDAANAPTADPETIDGSRENTASNNGSDVARSGGAGLGDEESPTYDT